MNKPLYIGSQKQQTAVSWLQIQLRKGIDFNPLDPLSYPKAVDNLFEQAKQMEKEQMKGMYVEGGFAQMRYFDGKEFITGEQYYNETYGK